MNYSKALQFLFDQLPMFSRQGASAMRPGLHNTIKLCEHFDNPQSKFPTIHIGGTNGKGSTSHMLAAILQQAGYKTGLYTSPHLHDFRERIKINGNMISEEEVTDFTVQVQQLTQELNPSFFEITVAMAFHHFARHQVDIAVVEVGLGGRLDSTNIIHPILSVITNIGWDHMNILGNTLTDIAIEKAGIIKQGVPVVIGESKEETDAIFLNKAQELQASIVFADKQRFAAEWKTSNDKLDVYVEESQLDEHRKHYQLDLPGVYQLKNLMTVLESVQMLKQQGYKLDDGTVAHALAHTKKINGLHGRWEVLGRDPLFIIDVAHNVDGMKQVLAQLELTEYKKLHFIIGMVKDKDVDKVLNILPREATYYFTKAQIPRALHEQDLHNKAIRFSLKGDTYPTLSKAVADAKHAADKDDLILICGSVFLVAELL